MGMYTELNIATSLRENTPKEIIDILKYMLCESEIEVKNIHPLFNTDGWKYMLVARSPYFIRPPFYSFVRDKTFGFYKLSVVSSFKNYENEIELFLDFINPYIENDGFIGYKMFEPQNTNDKPELIYRLNGEIKIGI